MIYTIGTIEIAIPSSKGLLPVIGPTEKEITSATFEFWVVAEESVPVTSFIKCRYHDTSEQSELMSIEELITTYKKMSVSGRVVWQNLKGINELIEHTYGAS